jgi:hypothetical protein
LNTSRPRREEDETAQTLREIKVVEHGADRDEPSHRVPNQHPVPHVEMLKNRHVVARHGRRATSVGTQRGTPMAPLVESDHPMAALDESIPHEIPFGRRHSKSVGQNHSGTLAGRNCTQHRSVRTVDENFVALRLTGQRLAWIRVGVGFNPRDGCTNRLPARRTDGSGQGGGDHASSYHAY